MNLNNKRVFVSGAAGVIGIQLVNLLEKEGCIIFAADKKDKPKEFSKNIFFRQGDLNFIKKHEIESYGCSIFFHLAATFERTLESFSFYEENFKHNISLSNKLLKLFGESSSVRKIIFASSYLIYDKSIYLKNKSSTPIKLDENSSRDTRNLVGTAKYLHEKEIEFFNKFSKKTKFYNVRIFRGYGLGSRDIISRWVRLALKNKKIKLYNAESSFDFIFCIDSARGLLKIAKSNTSKKTINLGSGKSEKIKNVIDVLKLFFRKLKIKNLKSDKLIEKSFSGNKIINKLNWKPIYNIRKGINRIIKYEKNLLKKNLNKKRKKIQNKKILLTSFGPKKVALLKHVNFAASRVDSNLEVLVGNSQINNILKALCGKIFLMPNIEKYEYKNLLKVFKKNNITTVIPTNGKELIFWSKNKKNFSNNKIDIVTSPYESIKLCTDKYKFFNFCKRKKILTINTIINIKNIDKLNSKKYVVKDRYGQGSQKIYKNITLKNLKEKLLEFDSCIIQDYIPSKKEYSVDAWYSGNFKLCKYFIRKRDYIENGESKITSSVKNYKFNKIIERYLNSFKLYGPVNFQFFEHKNKIILIECNPRFGGASTFSMSCGLDLFYYSILNSYYRNSMYDKILIKKILPKDKQIRLITDINEDYNF